MARTGRYRVAADEQTVFYHHPTTESESTSDVDFVQPREESGLADERTRSVDENS
jgi:hypothetical protein